MGVDRRAGCRISITVWSRIDCRTAAQPDSDIQTDDRFRIQLESKNEDGNWHCRMKEKRKYIPTTTTGTRRRHKTSVSLTSEKGIKNKSSSYQSCLTATRLQNQQKRKTGILSWLKSETPMLQVLLSAVGCLIKAGASDLCKVLLESGTWKKILFTHQNT